MDTYLLLWDPKDMPHESLFGMMQAYLEDEDYLAAWETTHADIAPGSRLYLYRIGEEPRGIFGEFVSIDWPEAANPDDGGDPVRPGGPDRFVPMDVIAYIDPVLHPEYILTEQELLDMGALSAPPGSTGQPLPEPLADRVLERWDACLARWQAEFLEEEEEAEA